jgi:hypothetical protein
MSTITEIKAGLEGLKTTVSGLKERATKLAATRETLIRQAATQEQTQAQALAELKELGVTPANLEPATLEALMGKASDDLNQSIAALEADVTAAEQLVTGTALSMD